MMGRNAAAATLRRSLRARAAALPLHAARTPLRALSTAAPGLSEEEIEMMQSEREVWEVDVLIIGGGPAGLAAAIRLAQLNEERGEELEICLVEKGAEVGMHVLSGNVFEPRALDELLPDWREMDSPIKLEATNDSLYYLTETRAIPLPAPPTLNNHGNYIISLGEVCAWLGEQAEEMGVAVFPATAASEILYDEETGAVRGVATRDVGIDKDGKPKGSFARGMELVAKQTLFAEGVRGSCSEEVIEKFALREEADADEQRYGLGVKEVWQIDPELHKPGEIVHTMGWPLKRDTYGGSFLYHAEDNKLFLGFVVGLDYPNPYLSPYMEFQRWKHHPKIAPLLEGAECLSYGARCINEGGWQSVPKLTFPGGALIGCTAGFVNVPKIKGSHTAMKTGMLAAESVFEALTAQAEAGGEEALEVVEYETAVRSSWVKDELWAVRNVQPSFHKGPKPLQHFVGLAHSGLTTMVTKGKEPWTLRTKGKDSDATLPADQCAPIDYPKPDGVRSFQLLSNLQRSGVDHEAEQPAHLRIKPELAHVPRDESMQKFAAPETRFCPAGVYQYPEDENGVPTLEINAQNCVHCKCCSIKMPQNYINWTVPEGGGGPNYQGM